MLLVTKQYCVRHILYFTNLCQILFKLNTTLFIEHSQLLHVSADFCHHQAWFTHLNCKVACFKFKKMQTNLWQVRLLMTEPIPESCEYLSANTNMCIKSDRKFYIHGFVHRESNLITVQQDVTYSVYYISVGSSAYFGCWHPSWGAHTTVITASGID